MKGMRRWKRFLAMLLVALMVSTLVPVDVFAEELEPEVQEQEETIQISFFPYYLFENVQDPLSLDESFALDSIEVEYDEKWYDDDFLSTQVKNYLGEDYAFKNKTTTTEYLEMIEDNKIVKRTINIFAEYILPIDEDCSSGVVYVFDDDGIEPDDSFYYAGYDDYVPTVPDDSQDWRGALKKYYEEELNWDYFNPDDYEYVGSEIKVSNQGVILEEYEDYVVGKGLTVYLYFTRKNDIEKITIEVEAKGTATYEYDGEEHEAGDINVLIQTIGNKKYLVKGVKAKKVVGVKVGTYKAPLYSDSITVYDITNGDADPPNVTNQVNVELKDAEFTILPRSVLIKTVSLEKSYVNNDGFDTQEYEKYEILSGSIVDKDINLIKMVFAGTPIDVGEYPNECNAFVPGVSKEEAAVILGNYSFSYIYGKLVINPSEDEKDNGDSDNPIVPGPEPEDPTGNGGDGPVGPTGPTGGPTGGGTDTTVTTETETTPVFPTLMNAAPAAPVVVNALTNTTPVVAAAVADNNQFPILVVEEESEEPENDPAPAAPAVVQVADEETPLANVLLDHDHLDCILHLLLMLGAMVIFGVYTHNHKKLQSEIQELEEAIEGRKSGKISSVNKYVA